MASLPQLEPVWLTVHALSDHGNGESLVGGLVGVRRRTRVPVLGHVDHFQSHLDGTSGGPLVAARLSRPDQERIFRILVDGALSLRRGSLCSCGISLNTDHEARFGALLAGDPRFQRRDVPAAVIDLTGGPEAVEMDRLAKNKRNERNRGLRRGARVVVSRDGDLLRRYYPIYEAACATWGTDPVPLLFLENLLAGPEETVFFTCVMVEGQVVGGHLNLQFGDRVMAWNGVTDPAFARSHFPATVAVWGDVEEACRRGARSLDLGASGGVVSLAGFKKFFGAEMEARGFYLNQSGGLRLLRRLAGMAARWRVFLGAGPEAGRWHDGPVQPGRFDAGRTDAGGSEPPDRGPQCPEREGGS